MCNIWLDVINFLSHYHQGNIVGCSELFQFSYEAVEFILLFGMVWFYEIKQLLISRVMMLINFAESTIGVHSR